MLPTERFTGRAQDYARYRSGDPSEIVDILQREIEFDSTKIVADVGSGTGLLTRVFLAAGN